MPRAPSFDADLLLLKQRLPDSMRFARPGQRVQILRVRSDATVTSVRLQIGNGGVGRTMTLSTKRYGGEDRTVRLAQALIDECGMQINTDGPGARTLGEPTIRNRTGAGNIQFRWGKKRGKIWGLSVLVIIGNASHRLGTRSFSVRKHGLAGAVAQAAAVRAQDGFHVDQDLVLANLQAELDRGPP